jgi:micrococcal nuclease
MYRVTSIFMMISLLIAVFLFTGCNQQKPKDISKITIPSTQVTVVDGDTIKIKLTNKTETVRFLLVDTPEIHDRVTDIAQPYSLEAKAFTSQMIKNSKAITIEKDKSDRDKYGRYLAYVYADGQSVQKALLENGLARVAYVFQPNTKYESQYRSIETTAERKKLGIWYFPNYSQANGFHPKVVDEQSKNYLKSHQSFIASKNSDVYHPASCLEVVNTIKPENRLYFTSEEAAKASGRHRSSIEKCWKM